MLTMSDPSDAPAALKDYEKVRLIGKGGFGQVFLVRPPSSDTLLVSKEIPIHSAAERDEVAREAQILSSVSHPNVIQFYSLHRAGAKMSILMEYANDGDVEQKLMQRKRRQLFLPKTVICQWVVQLFQALHYLHDRGFIHRDVKTANLFLTLEGYLKLGDFGVAKLLERNSTSIASRTAATPVGTPMYISPQICAQQPYTQKADMWAAGCCLYEMCTLEPAFTAKSVEQLMKRIKKGAFHASKIPAQYGDDAVTLITPLLAVDPDLRPTAAEALESSLVAEWVEDAPASRTARGLAPVPYPRIPDPSDLESKSTPNVLRLDSAAVARAEAAVTVSGGAQRKGHRRTSSDGSGRRAEDVVIKVKSPSQPSSPGESPRTSPRMPRRSRDTFDTRSPLSPPGMHADSPMLRRSRVGSSDTLSPPTPQPLLSPDSPRTSRAGTLVKLTSLDRRGSPRLARQRPTAPRPSAGPGHRRVHSDGPPRATSHLSPPPVTAVDGPRNSLGAITTPASNRLADHISFYAQRRHSTGATRVSTPAVPYRSPRQSPRPSPRPSRKSLSMQAFERSPPPLVEEDGLFNDK